MNSVSIGAGGDVILSGNLIATANGEMTAGNVNIDGQAVANHDGGGAGSRFNNSAYASFEGIDSSLIDGYDVSVEFMDIFSSNGGDVTISGDVTVSANGKRTVGAVTINGLASANRTGTEGSARASADFYGVDNDIFHNTAEVDAELDIYSELDDGNVPVSGDITVSGELTRIFHEAA